MASTLRWHPSMHPYRTPGLVQEHASPAPSRRWIVPFGLLIVIAIPTIALVMVDHAIAASATSAARQAAWSARARERDDREDRDRVRSRSPARVTPVASIAAVDRTRLADLGASPAESPLPWPPAILASSGPVEHRGPALLARAHRLATAGLDLRIYESTLRPSDLDAAAVRPDPFGARLLPYEHDGRPAGLAVLAFDDGSILERAGVRIGDVMTSFNGHALAEEGWFDHTGDLVRPGERGVVTVEIIRRGARVVLGIHWSR